MSLAERQLSLGGVVVGPSTGFAVRSVDVGAPEIRQADADMPREDGQRMGRDWRGQRVITIELSTLGQDESVRDQVALLERAWSADDVRCVAGAVTSLVYRFGAPVRRVFGRPRRFAADTRLLHWGRVDITCDFTTVDHRYYDDTEQSESLGIIPASTGGLVGPLIGPWIASGDGVGAQGLTIGGTEPAWLTCRIHGPITNPTVEVVDQWAATLLLSLAGDQWVEINPTPWGRSIRRNSGANAAGALTQSSQRLSGMRVPPGNRQVILRGNDPTGTASLTVSWRPAHASY